MSFFATPLALALEWARPGAAWALLLAPLFLLLVRVLWRPPEVVVGTLELWRGLPEARAGAAQRARFPPWALVGALGLLCGALAWLGPRGAHPSPPRRWTALVDVSPSMGLPLAPGGTRTRLAVALEGADAALRANLASADRVRWVRAGRAPLELARDERPPADWLAPEAGGSEPDWAARDAAGTLWITDAAPAVARAHAGLFASGGAECPGAITIEEGKSLWWENGELTRRARAAPPRVRVEEPSGATMPAVLEGVLRAWCEARGFELARDRGGDELFVLALAPGTGTAEPLRFGRDGWQGTGSCGDLGQSSNPDAGFEDWLSAHDGTRRRPVVRLRPGRIEVALRTLAEPGGDPAGFALSWARLFERAVVWPADVVPLAERLAAGAPVADLGTPPAPEARAGADLGPLLDAGLALAAGLCALLAGLWSTRGAAGSGGATPARAWNSRRPWYSRQT